MALVGGGGVGCPAGVVSLFSAFWVALCGTGSRPSLLKLPLLCLGWSPAPVPFLPAEPPPPRSSAPRKGSTASPSPKAFENPERPYQLLPLGVDGCLPGTRERDVLLQYY